MITKSMAFAMLLNISFALKTPKLSSHTHEHPAFDQNHHEPYGIGKTANEILSEPVFLQLISKPSIITSLLRMIFTLIICLD